MTQYFLNPGWRPEAPAILDPLACESAFNEIRGWQHYEETPLRSLARVAAQLSINHLFYKDEAPRFGLGSFKALGAPYALSKVLGQVLRNNRRTPRRIVFGNSSPEMKSLTAACATDGNHGRALAWSCAKFGCNCRVYLPSFVSSFRKKEIEKYGAHITVVAGTYDDAAAMAEQDAAKNNWLLICDSGSRRDSVAALVMRGFTVISHEVLKSAHLPITHCFVQAGGGGFAAAMADSFCRPGQDVQTKMIVVEPESAAGLFLSACHSRLMSATGSLKTIAGGLSCGAPSPLAWRILRRKAFAFMTLTDGQILDTLRWLWQRSV